MTVIEKIEAQQKGHEGSVAWCVGQTLKEICEADPDCARIVAEDLEIHTSMLEELRAQAETEAAEKAEPDLQKKLAEAAAALDREAAKRKAAEEQLEETRKRQKMAEQWGGSCE